MHLKAEDCIGSVRQLNSRQDNIILNALQFINDVVDNPDLATEGGVDEGFRCRLDKEERNRPEYTKLLRENHWGLLSNIPLHQRRFTKEL